MNRVLKFAFFAAILLGIALRLVLPDVFEYKLDELRMFQFSQNVGITESWQWIGLPSGVFVPNPGMSVWIFVILKRLFSITTPVGLNFSVCVFNCIAMLLMIWVVRKKLPIQEQSPWYWAIALQAVNPVAILYQRKIWAQSILPIFSVLFLWAWWSKNKKIGSFFWGLIGAILGQIHMSGFFFAAAFVLWGIWKERHQIQWKYWFFGSCLGSLPLIPWALHLFQNPTHQAVSGGWVEVIQLKFWVFWITDGFGLHLGKALGVGYGNSVFSQLWDSGFLSAPMVFGQPTYISGLAHLACVVVLVRLLLQPLKEWKKSAWINSNQTDSATLPALWIYGTLLTLSRITVRRYYMIITFPLQWVWLARLGSRFKAWLLVLALSQAVISVIFLDYIYKNRGAEKGDFGTAYRFQVK